MDGATIGQIGISAGIMALLGFVFHTFPGISNRYKPLIALCLGVVVSYLFMIYQEVAFTAKAAIEFGFGGMMAGLAAVGMYELQVKARQGLENKTSGSSRISALLLIFVICIALLSACSMTYKQTFLATHKTFNEMVSDYKAYYVTADKETQAKLNKNVTPKVLEALTLSIEINKVVTAGGEAPTVDKERFRELRYNLYALLPKIFNLED